MKKSVPTLLLFFLYISFFGNAQNPDPFKTDVKTKQKPWTNLEFYNNPTNFQFAIVSDNTGGMRQGIFEIGVEKLNMMMPEFVLSVGDLIPGYTEDVNQIRTEQDEFDAKVDKLKMPFFYLPGNHDINNPVMQKEWESRYGRRYYQFTYKDVLFIILDSNDDEEYNISEEQTSFALQTLKENQDARWTFVLVHHPVWKYNTGGRFGKIEELLGNRKHTVIAGHEHHYQYIEHKESNYYVLGTTGGGSRLRGNRFGEFDHIVWMTMTDHGPIMANLRLDGILSHDISNEATANMARSMTNNTNLRYMVLTNKGENFEHGTAYLHFKNDAEEVLKIDLSFLHHHQVDILPSKKKVKLLPGKEIVIEISVKANQPIPLDDLGFLQYYWKLSYEGAEYKDFYLDGSANFSISPSVPNDFRPQVPQFTENKEIIFDNPFSLLKQEVKVNGIKANSLSAPSKFTIDKSTDFEIYFKNEKNESTDIAIKSYEKIAFLKGKKNKNAVPGLKFNYYEGEKAGGSQYFENTPVMSGIAHDFDVEDIADNNTNFGIRYQGFIEVPDEGMYYFRCRADGEATLKIHEKLICQDGIDKSKGDAKLPVGPIGAIALSKGLHPVEIDFYAKDGGQIRFYYKMKENTRWNYIELEDLFRTKNK